MAKFNYPYCQKLTSDKTGQCTSCGQTLDASVSVTRSKSKKPLPLREILIFISFAVPAFWAYLRFQNVNYNQSEKQQALQDVFNSVNNQRKHGKTMHVSFFYDDFEGLQSVPWKLRKKLTTDLLKEKCIDCTVRNIMSKGKGANAVWRITCNNNSNAIVAKAMSF